MATHNSRKSKTTKARITDLSSSSNGRASNPARTRPREPRRATHSPSARRAVLGRNEAAAAGRLEIDYGGKDVRLNFTTGSDPAWSGPWGLEVRADGTPLSVSSGWEVAFWYSDRQMACVELEARLTGGFRIQRHLSFAHEDSFVLLADSLLGNRPANLEYRAWLPLDARTSFEPAEETREGVLCVGRRRILALPLALPEWQCDARPGSLARTDQGLALSQSAKGASLFAPLFFDLDSRRNRQPFTWRQLTVAENLQAVAADVAVGYRVMVGKKQWLIYRSLAPVGNRTLLGHNLISQLLVARFDRKGEVASLVEIE